MKQGLREALPKVKNPPSFTLRREKNKGGFVKLAPDIRISNSDGLDFLIPSYQKLQSIRNSNPGMFSMSDCSVVRNLKL